MENSVVVVIRFLAKNQNIICCSHRIDQLEKVTIENALQLEAADVAPVVLSFSARFVQRICTNCFFQFNIKILTSPLNSATLISQKGTCDLEYL